MSARPAFLKPRVFVPFIVIVLIWGSIWIVIKDQFGTVPPSWSVTTVPSSPAALCWVVPRPESSAPDRPRRPFDGSRSVFRNYQGLFTSSGRDGFDRESAARRLCNDQPGRRRQSRSPAAARPGQPLPVVPVKSGGFLCGDLDPVALIARVSSGAESLSNRLDPAGQRQIEQRLTELARRSRS